MTINYAPLRFYPATPIGSMPIAENRYYPNVTYATPFAINGTLTVKSLNLSVMSQSEATAKASITIFASGTNGLLSGVALAAAEIVLRSGGASDIGALVRVQPLQQGAMPAIMASSPDNFSAAATIGIDIIPTTSGIIAGLALQTSVDPTLLDLVGNETWQDLGTIGAPVTWLGT
jgi:hypothetical protein